MTEIWAHRGSSRVAPENTLPAFALAIEQGADGVELDVQLSADDELVVIHDETVDRTTDGTGRVVGLTLAQLRELDASAGKPGFAGTRLPTLAEALDVLVPSRARLNIELKNSVEDYPGLEEKVLAEIGARGIADRVVLSSFNHYSLKKLQRLGTTCELGMIYSDPLYRPWRYAVHLGVAALHPPARYVLRRRYVRKAHEAGLAVRPWVVNGQRNLTHLFDGGVDAVFTDIPDVALRLRDGGS